MDSGENRVFKTLAGFRVAAHAVQRWLTLLGLLATPACLIAWAADLLPGWTVGIPATMLIAGPAWGLAWRRHLSSCFWKGARIPRQGRPLNLPEEGG